MARRSGHLPSLVLLLFAVAWVASRCHLVRTVFPGDTDAAPAAASEAGPAADADPVSSSPDLHRETVEPARTEGAPASPAADTGGIANFHQPVHVAQMAPHMTEQQNLRLACPDRKIVKIDGKKL